MASLAFWEKSNIKDDSIIEIQKDAAKAICKHFSFRPAWFLKQECTMQAKYFNALSRNSKLTFLLSPALMTFHFKHRHELMGAFLDEWGISHKNGYILKRGNIPSVKQVQAARKKLETRFEGHEIDLYLATAGR